ncbi:hypothetical protein [Novipirellula sp.]|uniref:hypothetical protein n=1 Tax=Novipirellula sp. TaxID=2795430 RepID=UPI003566FC91
MVTKTRKTATKKTTPKTTSKKKATTPAAAIVTLPVRGLKGQGLLQLGRESKLELRDRLAMPRQMFGRMVNVSERTIAKVEANCDQADKLTRPYNEVYRLWEALSDVVDPESLGIWFQTPNDAFDGLKPLEIIERGEIDRLWNMVFQLRSGMPG